MIDTIFFFETQSESTGQTNPLQLFLIQFFLNEKKWWETLKLIEYERTNSSRIL